MRTLFRRMVDEARTEVDLATRSASIRYLRQAHEDIVKVADEGPQVTDQAILTVAAMYDLHQWEPTNFASDDGFRVQLARRFRTHSDVNVAVSWSQADGKTKRVYRDASSRRLVTLGQLLARALGSSSMTIIATMGREAAVEAQERQDALARLRMPSSSDVGSAASVQPASGLAANDDPEPTT